MSAVSPGRSGDFHLRPVQTAAGDPELKIVESCQWFRAADQTLEPPFLREGDETQRVRVRFAAQNRFGSGSETFTC